jgi:hypothetical protein
MYRCKVLVSPHWPFSIGVYCILPRALSIVLLKIEQTYNELRLRGRSLLILMSACHLNCLSGAIAKRNDCRLCWTLQSGMYIATIGGLLLMSAR